MNRYARGRKTFVLSVRVNETERKQLQEASAKTGRDVSTLLRQSINAMIKEMQAG